MHIHNSLTREKEEFIPLETNKVRIYVCGVTTYDYCHVGHARCYSSFDTVVRYLRWSGYDVEYVRNITDVNDSITKRAKELKISEKALVTRYIDAMYEDFDALNILRPNHEPKATETIQGMQEIIASLIERGLAYQSFDSDNNPGDVFFSVEKFPEYGRLSNRSLEDLQAGARIEINTAKNNPYDFALWKLATEEINESVWDSPWGRGRPGWHIECSAMSKQHFGDHFDIHGGGMDLKFPHHENEIAQSCGASGHDFVNIWMHNGFVNIDNEKMSKSLNNFFTIREVLKHYHPEEIRLVLMSSHYRGPINYSDQELNTARSSLQRFYTALRGLDVQLKPAIDTEYEKEFKRVMDDDFNTPRALAVLFDLARNINVLKEKEEAKPETARDYSSASAQAALLIQLGNILGLLFSKPQEYLQGGSSSELASEDIESLITARNQARSNKDWAESDRIRDELLAKGIILEDSAGITTWRAK